MWCGNENLFIIFFNWQITASNQPLYDDGCHYRKKIEIEKMIDLYFASINDSFYQVEKERKKIVYDWSNSNVLVVVVRVVRLSINIWSTWTGLGLIFIHQNQREKNVKKMMISFHSLKKKMKNTVLVGSYDLLLVLFWRILWE